MDIFFFDLDGTLIDTEKYYNSCWVRAITDAGYNITPAEALDLRSLGRPHVYKYFEEKYGSGFEYEKIKAYRKKIMEEVIRCEGIQQKPGAEALLKALKEQGKQCIVVTASDTDRSERYLAMAGLRQYIDRIICAQMVKEGKPSPDIYLYACEAVGKKPCECIAAEDSPNGVASAYRAGCRVAFIPDLSGPDDNIRSMADYIYDDLNGMLADFERVNNPSLAASRLEERGLYR